MRNGNSTTVELSIADTGISSSVSLISFKSSVFIIPQTLTHARGIMFS